MVKAKSNRLMAALLVVLLVCGSSFSSDGPVAEPESFFRQYIGLNDEQISQIQNGKAVAKILNAPTSDQVFVFGSVYIQATPESYLKFAADLDRLLTDLAEKSSLDSNKERGNLWLKSPCWAGSISAASNPSVT